MMMNSEALFEAAERHSSQERGAAIAVAQAQVGREGTEVCVDCGSVIPQERRAKAPFAVRCIECQTFYESEKLSR